MSRTTRLRAYFHACAAAGALSVATTSAFAAPPCQFTPPLTTQTKCVTAVPVGPNPLLSYDISFVNPDRGEYYLADRSNSSIDIINTKTLTLVRQLTGFAGFSGNNDTSGPDGVATHGRWLYAGDFPSLLRIFDLNSASNAEVAHIATGGVNRLDEMALTTDGKLLIAANNADSPAFATLFKANGDAASNTTSIITRINIDPAVLGGGSIEQPAWDPKTARFVTSVPQILNNPPGCVQSAAPAAPAVPCQGGLLFVDPTTATAAPYGLYNPATNTGVLPLHDCGPNGASVGPHDNVLLGCTPQNVGTNITSQVMNLTTRNFVEVGNITGYDEVWYNSGDNRYYTGSNRNCKPGISPCPTAPQQSAVLGVIDAETNFLIETVPQSSGSHSVAADSKRNLIFVPQNAQGTAAGHDTTTVSLGICGTPNGCVAVYRHDVDDEDDDHGHGHDGDDHGHDH
jgi:hypothetical protein